LFQSLSDAKEDSFVLSASTEMSLKVTFIFVCKDDERDQSMK